MAKPLVWGHTHVVDYLLQRGAAPNLRDDFGVAALHKAMGHGGDTYPPHFTPPLAAPPPVTPPLAAPPPDTPPLAATPTLIPPLAAPTPKLRNDSGVAVQYKAVGHGGDTSVTIDYQL